MQTFRDIIKGDYVYADKTKYVYDLINGVKYYFLSRPRRFGKSLLLDTISEAFSGDRELFRGLWIYGSDFAFEKHPVIRLDMSNISNENPEILKRSLIADLSARMRALGIAVSDGEPGDLLKTFIMETREKYGQRVVVLVDEYDKPILDHLLNAEIAEANRQVLRSLFGVLKSMDPYLRFAFVTGVSKFTKTSIFSELNNLLDITMTEKYASICGIEINELDLFFSEHIAELKTANGLDIYPSVRNEILSWYDGYSWDGRHRVINPFSLLSFFEQKRFYGFWYASGTPKFLIDIVKSNPAEYINMKNPIMTEYMLDSADFSKLEAIPLFFQSGYLTVKGVHYASGAPTYILDMPNQEVRDAFNKNIVASFTDVGHAGAERARVEINQALMDGDLQKTLSILRSLFSSIPYELRVDREAYYHSIFYAIMTVLGFDIDAEVSVANGRVDAVLEFSDKVYVMEFKYINCPPDAKDEDKRKLIDQALSEALKQILEKGYANPYISSGKTIYRVAFAFLGRDQIEMACFHLPPR